MVSNSFKHISFSCPFLDPDLTMHHLSISMHSREVTKLGQLTLVDRKKVTLANAQSGREPYSDLTRKQHNPHYVQN